MADESVAPGIVRLRIQTTQHAPTWATVGPFESLSGARRLAEDLIAQQAVQAVRVEHHNKGAWRPAWSFLAGLGLLLLVSTGCACFKPTLTAEELSTCSVYAGALAGGAAYRPVPPPPPIWTDCDVYGRQIQCRTSR